MRCFSKSLTIFLIFVTFYSHAEIADQVLVESKIYTANPLKPWAESIAIKNGKIIFVGDEKQLSTYIDSTTKIHNLSGKSVLPGLVDAHTHPGMVALSLGNLVLPEVDTQAQLLDEVSKMARENQHRKVLIGGYWDNGLFEKTGPNKELLDAIEPNKPLILFDAWAHSVWANSAALKAAGVDRNTIDVMPNLAFYQRDDNGEATGWITESAASVFLNHFYSMTPAVEQSMLAYLQYLKSKGITTILDGGNFGLDDETYKVISRWDKEGILPVRYNGSYTLFLPKDYPTAVEKLKKLQKKYGGDKLSINTLKVFLDGVTETRTAYQTIDYLDTPNNNGHAILEQDQLSKLVVDLHHNALNMHIHSVGNKATKMMLNAVEDAHKKIAEPLKTRITLCHLETVDDEDYARFKTLGVSANFTPHWHAGDSTEYEAAVGKIKAKNTMRAQPLISDGVSVSFSSDITDETEWKRDRANPFLGMQIAHNKQDIEGGASAPIASPISERLSLTALVDGYSRQGAFQLSRDDIGTIEVGKSADFIILNQNLFKINRYDIHKTEPEAVIVEGHVEFGEIK